MIGERLKHAFIGNSAWILSYRDECFDKIGLKASKRIPLFNGALDCEFRQYEIFDGKYREFLESGETLDKEQKEQKERKAPAGERREYKPREKREHGSGERRDFKPRDRKDRESGEKKNFSAERRPRSGESYPERKKREQQKKEEQ